MCERKCSVAGVREGGGGEGRVAAGLYQNKPDPHIKSDQNRGHIKVKIILKQSQVKVNEKYII